MGFDILPKGLRLHPECINHIYSSVWMIVLEIDSASPTPAKRRSGTVAIENYRTGNRQRGSQTDAGRRNACKGQAVKLARQHSSSGTTPDHKLRQANAWFSVRRRPWLWFYNGSWNIKGQRSVEMPSGFTAFLTSSCAMPLEIDTSHVDTVTFCFIPFSFRNPFSCMLMDSHVMHNSIYYYAHFSRWEFIIDWPFFASRYYIILFLLDLPALDQGQKINLKKILEFFYPVHPTEVRR